MPEKQKTTEEIKQYEQTDSAFVDYARFEGDAAYRQQQKQAFIGDYEYVPQYDYNKLTFLIDEQKLQKKRTNIEEALFELEVAKASPDNNPAEIELYQEYHELRLKKIRLVEAARDLLQARTSSAEETARETFLELGAEIYGELDTETYLSMLHTEAARLEDFEPKNRNATLIKNELSDVFQRMELAGDQVEQPLMSPENLHELQTYVFDRYHNVLAQIPDTPDDVYYDAEACVEIFNRCLLVSGLFEEGWRSLVNPAKQNVATGSHKIKLPPNTRRNARELRRLVLHEQEVHARRAQNGDETGLNVLEDGTADYADVEEGLGVLFECALEGNFDNPSFYRARDRYITAGLAEGADSAPRDARETYEILWRMLAIREAKEGVIHEDDILTAKDQAYTHIENAFRGTKFYQKGVYYPKLKVYYEGLKKNAEFFAQAIENHTLDHAMDVAMIGKINHTNSDEVALVKQLQ